MAPFDATQLSSRLDGVSESATLKLNAMVNQMKAQGLDVVNFSAGEPDYSVPELAKQAVKKAVDQNLSKYTPAAGTLELRTAIAKKTNIQQPELAKTQPWKFTDVVVSNGGKQALFNTFFSILNEGDEVLIPSPYWLSYPEMVKLCGGVPRFISTSLASGFKVRPEDLVAALTPRSRILVLNSPSNPTGAMYTRKELRALVDALAQHPLASRLCVVSDEIYDRICFNDGGDHPFVSFLDAAPEWRDRTITVNGMSKSAAMTGWRVGWSVAPQWVTSALLTLQGQSTSGINALAQAASVAALSLPEEEFAYQVASFKKRRDLVLEILKKNSKLEWFSPDGAFYAFFGIRNFLKPGQDSMGFCEDLLAKKQVALVPGTPFGAPQFVRMSFATDEASLKKGCERILEYLKSIDGP